MRRRFLSLVAAAILFWGGPAQALKLVAPLDRVVVQEKTLRVHGTGAEGSQVRIQVESATQTGEAVARLDKGNLFEVAIPLAPGLNRITVGGESREVFLAGSGKAPPGFSSQRLHGGDLGRCGDCHEPDLGLRKGGYPGVCLTCHVVASANPDQPEGPDRNLHFRANIAKCGRCHEPHASRDAKLLRGSSESLCGECHPKLKGNDETHAAYGEGGCTACHDAHFSGYPSILRGKIATVCQECHDQGAGPGVRHAPLGKGRACATCHDPHGSADDLLASAPKAQCGACHAEVLRAGHKDELGACAECHDAHGAPGKGLLRADLAERCAECHDGVGSGKTVHGALEKGCQGCHDPHRDGDTARAAAACGTCHDPAKSPEMASLHGGLDLPPATCSGCHPAHASKEDRLVRAALHYPLTQGKCAACHGKGTERTLRPAGAAACRGCHPFEKEMARKGERLHEPVADGDCSACHDPHMSKRSGLLRAAQAETCGECHDLPAPGGGREPHAAAETCSDCHRPHGGGTGAFLAARPDELCAGCHDGPPPGAERHPALEDGCLTCHAPHGGYASASLREPQKDLCLECHDDPARGPSQAHRSTDRGCATCHEPHASDSPHFLREERSAAAPAARPASQ